MSISLAVVSWSLCTPGFAALWESDGWALTGNASGSVTYDSNVFGFRDGEGDTIFAVNPGLTLQRKGSITDLSFGADVSMRYFADLGDEDSVDPTFAINYAYPNAEETLISQRARFTWRRISYPDLSVGDRVRNTELSGNWDGTLRDNGKTKIVANLSGSKIDYARYESDVTSYGGGFGMAWSPRSLFEYRLVANYSRSKYEESVGGGGGITRSGYFLNLGVRGDFSAKISGEASVGLGKNEYSGAFDGSDNDWSMSSTVTWTPDERREVSFNGNRGTNFNALGQSYDRSDFSLNVRQAMAGGFFASGRAGFGQYDYSDLGVDRRDGYVRFGAGLSYDRTGRFSAALEYNWFSKDSDLAFYNFSKYDVSATCGWRF